MVFESVVEKISAVRDQVREIYAAAGTEVLEAGREARAEEKAWLEDMDGALADLRAQVGARLERVKGVSQPPSAHIPQPEREAPQVRKCSCAPCPPCDGAWQAPPSENASEAPPIQKIAAKVSLVSEDWALAFVYFLVTCWGSMVVTRFLRFLYPEISRDVAILIMIGLPIINGMILLYENWA